MDVFEKCDLFAREYHVLLEFLYRYVRYRVSDRQEAEDIVADVCVQGYAKIEEYDEHLGTLRQWMCGIVRYRLLMYWRTKKMSISFEEWGANSYSEIDDLFHEHLDHKMAIERILERLTGEEKALLAMRYEDEMTYEELANVFGKEVSAVRQWFSRLHRRLRLEEKNGEDILC